MASEHWHYQGHVGSLTDIVGVEHIIVLAAALRNIVEDAVGIEHVVGGSEGGDMAHVLVILLEVMCQTALRNILELVSTENIVGIIGGRG
ncbi:hypothetical protein Moror_5394, partial [Moniliophthora roreri MCA 2997]